MAMLTGSLLSHSCSHILWYYANTYSGYAITTLLYILSLSVDLTQNENLYFRYGN